MIRKKIRKPMLLAGMLLGLATLAASGAKPGTLPTAEQVDLARYQGTWYEIARLPLFFENKCVAGVTANYTLLPDGKMAVVNRCTKADGKVNVSKGTITLADKAGPPSRLKVTFFWPLSGDYWILDLDPEYRWAVVGTPDRENLWILSRTSHIDPSIVDRLLASAKAEGFNTSKMIYTKYDK
jgi:apolipoprotein D and lipocalin family protein